MLKQRQSVPGGRTIAQLAAKGVRRSEGGTAAPGARGGEGGREREGEKEAVPVSGDQVTPHGTGGGILSSEIEKNGVISGQQSDGRVAAPPVQEEGERRGHVRGGGLWEGEVGGTVGSWEELEDEDDEAVEEELEAMGVADMAGTGENSDGGEAGKRVRETRGGVRDVKGQEVKRSAKGGVREKDMSEVGASNEVVVDVTTLGEEGEEEGSDEWEEEGEDASTLKVSGDIGEDDDADDAEDKEWEARVSEVVGSKRFQEAFGLRNRGTGKASSAVRKGGGAKESGSNDELKVAENRIEQLESKLMSKMQALKKQESVREVKQLKKERERAR